MTITAPPAAPSSVRDDDEMIRRIMPRIISAYRSPIERAYCRVRFIILRERFTKEIAQYLPQEGAILELGCGFGLFTLLFAHLRPGARFYAFDLNPRRIRLAREAAESLGVKNVRFHCKDVTELELGTRGGAAHADSDPDNALSGPFQAGYMMDLAHHVPPDAARRLIARIHDAMDSPSVFVLKDVDASPFYKRWFTRVLDFLVSPRDAVRYWPEKEMRETLRGAGWDVVSHAMVDFLPYPHQIYLCRK